MGVRLWTAEEKTKSRKDYMRRKPGDLMRIIRLPGFAVLILRRSNLSMKKVEKLLDKLIILAYNLG